MRLDQRDIGAVDRTVYGYVFAEIIHRHRQSRLRLRLRYIARINGAVRGRVADQNAHGVGKSSNCAIDICNASELDRDVLSGRHIHRHRTLIRVRAGGDRSCSRNATIHNRIGKAKDQRVGVVHTAAAAFDSITVSNIEIESTSRAMDHPRDHARQSQRWRRWQRPDVCATTARPDRERGRATIDLHVPNHRVRQSVFESIPSRRRRANVVSIIKSPIRPGENLLRPFRIHNDGINRNVGKISGFIRPAE